jgi:hypothetical protein
MAVDPCISFCFSRRVAQARISTAAANRLDGVGNPKLIFVSVVEKGPCGTFAGRSRSADFARRWLLVVRQRRRISRVVCLCGELDCGVLDGLNEQLST